MLRWIGAAMLLFCISLAGVSRAQAERRRLARARGFLALLQYIKRQIECFSMPIGDILRTADGGLLAACGAAEPFPDAFPALLAGAREELPAEIYGELCLFAESLGSTYRAEQLRLCEQHLARLSALCEALSADAPRRERLWLCLPPALAGIVILVLL